MVINLPHTSYYVVLRMIYRIRMLGMQQYESLPMAQWDPSGGSERRTGLGDSDWRPNNRSNAKLIIHDGVTRHTAEIRYSQDSGTINNGYICMHKRYIPYCVQYISSTPA